MPLRRSRPARPCKYTAAQVLRGMQAFVAENCGPNVVLELDKPLYDYFDAAVASHECPLEFLSEMVERFDLAWRESRWAVWLRLRSAKRCSEREREEAWERWKREVAPTITVDSLVQLIARKAVASSLAPATVLGVTCEKAGVFLGICDMPEVRGRRVAPSTPLRALRSSFQIRELCRRLEWVAGVNLPSMHGPKPGDFSTWGDAAWSCGICAAFFAGTAAMAVLGWTGAWPAAALMGAVAGAAVLALGWRIADRIHDPLPAGLTTFGDLARVVAGAAARV